MGEALYYQKKLEEAILTLRQAIKVDANAFTYATLGDALRKRNKLDDAIAAYRQALSLPDELVTTRVGDVDWVITNSHAMAHNGLGLVLQQQGKLEEAIQEFQRAISLDANYTAAQNNLKEAQRLAGL